MEECQFILTNSDILVTKADVACCLDRAIVIRTEALEALRSSPRSRKFLKTILDHAIKYGPGHSSSEHDERTPEEKEVDAFLQNLGYFN